MARKKKDDDAASVPKLTVPEEPSEYELGGTATTEPAKDKVAEVLDEIKSKSTEIVIRQTFANAKEIHTTHGVSEMLDKTLGIDKWSINYTPFGPAAVKCDLTIYFGYSSYPVTKSGIGVIGFVAPSATLSEQMRAAQQDAYFAAAAEFGIQRNKRAMKEYNLAASPPATPPLGPKPAAAASPPPPPPPPPPNPLPERPGPKPQQEVLAERVSFWVQELAKCDTPEHVNNILPGLSNEPAFAKGEIWSMIQATCKGDPPGWSYDPKARQFFDPKRAADVEDTIPF